MPHITEVNIDSSQVVITGNDFVVTVIAKIKFSEVERNIGLNYNTTIALYQIDETMDVYSVFPNNHQLFLQRATRGGKDGFLGFSTTQKLSAQTGIVEIKHLFSVTAIREPDKKMELKALVVCVPETATAMQWSSIKEVQVAFT